MSEPVKLEPQFNPADPELELVIAVIRRGLVHGDKLREYEEKLVTMALALKEAKRRLLNLNRIGQEVCRQYRNAIERPAIAQIEKRPSQAQTEIRLNWIREKSNELKEQLE
jgi:hypothetical protein